MVVELILAIVVYGLGQAYRRDKSRYRGYYSSVAIKGGGDGGGGEYFHQHAYAYDYQYDDGHDAYGHRDKGKR